MKVLLTGHSGFLGLRLWRELLKRKEVTQLVGISRGAEVNDYASLLNLKKYDAVGIYCDVAYEFNVYSLFRYFKPDVIFHLAGNPKTKEDKDNRTEITKDNVLGTHNLLAHCPEGCRFVFASSGVVYGNGPVNRGSAEYDLPSPCSAYASSKLAGEAYVEGLTKFGRVRGVSLRLIANVGGGATHGLVKDIVRKLKSDSPTLELFGEPPGSCKPFCYVGDTAKAFILLGLDKQFLSGAFNVSPEDSISVHQVALEVMGALGTKKDIVWKGAAATWPGDNPYVRLCSSKLRSFGWIPQYKTSSEAVRAGCIEL